MASSLPRAAQNRRSQLANALWALRHGFRVFPLEMGSKKPNGRLVPRGVKESTRDEGQVRRWWARAPYGNVGIHGGVIVDCDSGIHSLEQAEGWRERTGLPATLAVRTGRRTSYGVQYHYGGQMPSSPYELDGVTGEVRSGNLYGLAPGSIHPDTGEPYQVVIDLPMADYPPGTELERAKSKIQKNLGKDPNSLKPGQKIQPSFRQYWLVSQCGRLRRTGLSGEPLFEALRALCDKYCEKPGEKSNAMLRQICESGERNYGVHVPASANACRVPFNLSHIIASEPGASSPGRPDPSPLGSPAESKPSSQPDASAWPKPLAAEAFHGLAGEVVRAIEPHTEADPAGLLIQFLAAFGNVVGGSPYFRVEADRHRGNLFVVLVGVTSVARKGTSLGHIRRVFQSADSEWASSRVISGLSSGEGLIWAVRDPIEKHEAVRQKGRTVGYETVTADHGVSDKRALIIETEFSSPLRVADREGNTLSAMVRDAWDTGDLCTLTKNSPARATGAHISIIGHVTREELLRYLNSTEMGNGFANRFLWVSVRRSRCLPDGGSFRIEEHSALLNRLADCIRFARSTEEVTRDKMAGGMWRTVYEKLSAGRPGLLGSITSRAPAQVVRLCLLFALLDCSAVIREQHMLAALAVWDYCAESARFTFGDSLGYPEADRILGELRANPQGLTRTNIRDMFGRNRSEPEIEAALRCLTERSLAVRETRKTDGRSAEMWTAVGTTETTDTTKG